MADRAVDTLADQGVQRRAQGKRQTVAETEVGQDQRHDGVDRPGMQPPVEKGDVHGFAGGGHRVGVTHGRVDEVHHRFGHTEEHQADAHAGREQHGEPAFVGVVGLAMVRAQLDVAVAAYGQEDDADQHQCDGEDVEPGCIGDDPLLNLLEDALGMRLEHCGVQHQ